jgi:hypothetical protein
MSHRRWIAAGVLALMVGVLGATVVGPASAATSRQVVRTGACSGSSTWMLTLKNDNGKIEADLEVQTPKAGQTWNSLFRDNGTVFARATKTTQADGSFSVTRYARNHAGTDHIRVRSVNVTTGEVCIATAAF